MTTIEPSSVEADGNLKAVFVPAIADPANPTETECTALGCEDLSCYFTDDGYNPTNDQAVVTDNRLCSKNNFQRPGRNTDSLDVKYVYNLRNALEDMARRTLTESREGFLVLRWGAEFEPDLAAADIVDVVPIACGVQAKDKPTANQVLTISQKLFITSPGVQRDVVITAS